MSDTPIYDQLTAMQKTAQHSGALKLKHNVLEWIKLEIKEGRLKNTIDVDKIIKGVEGIKTWENESQNENQSSGDGNGTKSKTSGTPSKSPRSDASSKTLRTQSKTTSAKAK